jgi:hypothetical protein
VIIEFGVLLNNGPSFLSKTEFDGAFGGLLLAMPLLPARRILSVVCSISHSCCILIAKDFSNGYASAKRIVLIVLAFR